MNKKINAKYLHVKINIKISILIRYMIEYNILLTPKQNINYRFFKFVLKMKRKSIKEEKKKNKKLKKKEKINIKVSTPIVTIMGHVDHGKTSLVDYLKSTKVISYESSGITQNLKTYQVHTKNGIITFLDTPGHSNFSYMRKRSMKMTNIIVLIVAADDGIMPQTIESIKYAQSYNIPIIIAINKIDKVKLNIEKITNDLSKYKIISEQWGGENIFVNVSAKYGVGIDDLLDSILLQSEILEINTHHNVKAHGIIIESYTDINKIPIVTILINKGTLHLGDIILCGSINGKISSIKDFKNRNIIKAVPGTPVSVIGFEVLPITGKNIIVIKNKENTNNNNFKKNNLKKISLKKKNIKKTKLKKENINNNNLKKKNKINDVKNLNFNEYELENNNIININIILKTDKKGSIKDILNELNKIMNKNVKINIIESNIGNITKKDTLLAFRYKAIILGFNVEVEDFLYNKKNKKLKYIYCYNTIYNLIKDIKNLVNKNIKYLNINKFNGLIEIKNIFNSSKFGIIAGCIVLSGKIDKNNYINIIRDNKIIYKGYLESLRRFKKCINKASFGMECGITIKNYNNFKIGDKIKFFNNL
ncbi:translation initiation factor IF-2 [Candidatus Annandia adelgestsuga]|uniref:translation initiation factor IF-2 n=1 Tax=Candidatus Annandia adelgestsuga TaxID=1302411 RepID=UPI000F7F39FA|nr:translation initiation factor IF-2 [Candidatus Annandia adelgestsuga]